MSQISPWARVKLPVFVLVILLVIGAVAWPYMYAPTKVLAACSLKSVASTNSLGAVQPVTFTATPSFSVGSVTEHPDITLNISPFPASLQQKISAGFRLVLSKAASAAATGASTIVLYQSDLTDLKVANGSASAVVHWTIPAVPSGEYRITPFLTDAATESFGASLHAVSLPLTIQSTFTSFAWINPRSLQLSAGSNQLSGTVVNTTGAKGTAHLSSQVFEGVKADAAHLKNAVTADVDFTADSLSKDFTQSLPGLSTYASANVQLVSDFGTYKQYLDTRFGGETAAGFAGSSFTVKRAVLGHTSKLIACINLPDLAVPKGSVSVRWFHGSTQVGHTDVSIADKVGQIGIDTTRFSYANTPDHAQVDLLKDGHVLDTISINSAL